MSGVQKERQGCSEDLEDINAWWPEGWGQEIEAKDERHFECNDEIMIMILHYTQYAIDRSGGVWRLMHSRCMPCWFGFGMDILDGCGLCIILM